MKRMLAPAIWGVYLAIVFEFLFMITPFALYFYSAYRPALGILNRSPLTAWLTAFFLPHFSVTSSPLLQALSAAGWMLAYLGLGLFLISAFQLYASKLFGRGAVTGWLYARIRHPQYVALAVLGLGTTLIWPRFFVLLTYLTMLFVYRFLARVEEQECARKYGASYCEYQEKTGAFLPRKIEDALGRLLPHATTTVRWRGALLYVAVIAFTIGVALGLREHTLSSISAAYLDDAAVVSPARLHRDELLDAYRIANEAAATALAADADIEPLVAYVVPGEWYMPDLPMDSHDVVRERGGHGTPAAFDRRHFQVLLAGVRTHADDPHGRSILRRAHGIDPLLIVDVDMLESRSLGVRQPPATVIWGDIAGPLF